MKRKTIVLFSILSIALFVIAGPAAAQTGTVTNITLYETDMPLVVEYNALADEGSSYWGDGAWRNDSAAYKSVIHISPLNPLFSALGIFTVNDIASITYATNKLDTGTQADWYVSIYTAPGIYTTPCTGSWYCERLTVDPLYGYNRTNPPVGTWVFWDTNGAVNQTITYDGNHAPYGWYAGVPTLPQTQAGDNFWSYSSPYWAETVYPTSTNIVYEDQVVMDLAFETGSGWNDVFDAYIDAISITLKNGNTLNIDLEVDPPEPVTCDNERATDGRLNADDLCAPIAVFSDAGCNIQVYETNDDGSLASLINGGRLFRPVAQTGPVCSADSSAVDAAVASAVSSGAEVVIASSGGVDIIALPNGLIKVEQFGLYGYEFDPSEICFSLGYDPVDMPDVLPGTGGRPVMDSPWLGLGILGLLAAAGLIYSKTKK